MKALVLGVVHRAGVAKKTGQPYDFCVLKTLSPISQVRNENMTVKGFGFSEVEVSCDSSAVPQFSAFKFPCEIDLATDHRPDNYGKLEVVVTGVAK